MGDIHLGSSLTPSTAELSKIPLPQRHKTKLIQPPPLPHPPIRARPPLPQQPREAPPHPHRHAHSGIDPSCLCPRAEEREDKQRHGDGDVAVEGEDADGGEVGDGAPVGRVDCGPGVGREGLGDVDVEPVDVEGEVDEEEEEGHDEEAQEAGGVEGVGGEDCGDAGAVAVEAGYYYGCGRGVSGLL